MKEPHSKCYVYATKYIYRYPKTEQELKVKLYEKGFSEIDINNTIEYLKLKNFVNDQKFVEMYLNSEVVKKGKPLFVVKGKLIQKGVDKELIEDCINEQFDEINDGLKKKISNEINKFKQKGMEGFDIIQKLMKKGYKLDLIKEVINEKNN